MGPVDQRQAFFGRQFKGRHSDTFECFTARPGDPLVLHFAFADQRQGQMSEGGQVARGAYRAAGGDDRNQIVVEHLQKSRGDHGAYAGIAAGQAGGQEEHHASNHRFGEWFANPGRMGADQVDLKLLEVLVVNSVPRQRSKSRVEAVCGVGLAGQGFNGSLCGGHR